MKVLIEIEDESTTEDLIDIQRDYAIDYKVLSGMTNGEIIMTLFNCMVIEISNGKVYVEHIYFPFDEEWWNAPYKKEEFDEILERTNAVVCDREWYERAVKALEARGKMIEDIENINDTVHDGTNHFYKTAEDIKMEVIDIINKHLGEVEE